MSKFFVERHDDGIERGFHVVERERGVVWATFYDFDGEPGPEVRAKQYAAFLETLIEVQEAASPCKCGHIADMHYPTEEFDGDFPGQPPCNAWDCGCLRYRIYEGETL